MNLPSFIRENVALAKFTTFGIGGPARWLAEPANREELGQTLDLAAQLGVPVKIMGGGSNLLVSDDGVQAMVVRLSPQGEFGAIHQDPADPLVWRVGAAAAMQSLVGETARLGVAGLESMAGIPGSVGGAVFMNSGPGGGGIGEFVVRAEVMAFDSRSSVMEPPELAFGYRRSNLKGVIAHAFTFRFRETAPPHVILGTMREFRERKRAGQPLAIPSAGCMFKNPENDSAGGLIEMAGCKGMAEGKAMVSTLHANFIINQGGATCRDVVALACRVREEVLRIHGVLLEPEVVMWGEDSDFGCFKGRPHVDN